MATLEAPRPHFLPADVDHLIATSPYMALARERRAVRFLEAQIDAGRECRATLLDYPACAIEPLEFFYTCLHSLGAFGPALFADLTAGTWRGVVWASWLALLRPHPTLRPPLARLLAARGPALPHNRWLIEAAARAASGRDDDAPIARAAETIRALLAPVPAPATPIRRVPDDAERALIATEARRVGAIYRVSGAQAARAAIEASPARTWWTPYPAWAAAWKAAGRPTAWPCRLQAAHPDP